MTDMTGGGRPASGMGPPTNNLTMGNGVRGVKRHSDEPPRPEDMKPSKEPMLSDHHVMSCGAGGASSGGGGVLHKLLGPAQAPLTVAALQSPPPQPPMATTTITTSSTTGGATSSKLCEKNKMLASLLAKTPMQSTLSTSIASPKPSALPQEKLPKDLKVCSSTCFLVSLDLSRCSATHRSTQSRRSRD